eukprot:1145447-Pelagomonas_calceolata.AAC.9
MSAHDKLPDATGDRQVQPDAISASYPRKHLKRSVRKLEMPAKNDARATHAESSLRLHLDVSNTGERDTPV